MPTRNGGLRSGIGAAEIRPLTTRSGRLNSSAIGVHRRLRTLGVEIATGARPLAFEHGAVRIEDVFSRRRAEIGEVRLLVYATPRRVRDALAHDLADLGCRLIGDCMAPRNLMIAIHEGHAVGSAL